MLCIESPKLRVEIKEKGAELTSVYDKEKGREMLWQGEKPWQEQAPILFPFVGRLQGKHYFYNEKKYPMDLHGFAKESLFRVVECDKSSCLLELRDTALSRASYPFSFRLRQSYKLEGASLLVETKVENLGVETIHFALGFHPGFHIFSEEEKISDFEVSFPKLKEDKLEQVYFSEDCLTEKERGYFRLKDKSISLSSALFRKDALVFFGTESAVFLHKRGEKGGIYMEYPDYPYIGLWQPYKKSASFLCIEPWTSLPGRAGVEEDIAKREDFITLLPEEERRFHIKISFSFCSF